MRDETHPLGSLYTDMVHRLRMRGWSRIDAEDEAQSQLEKIRQRTKEKTDA